jgi:hypothetical protein
MKIAQLLSSSRLLGAGLLTCHTTSGVGAGQMER